MADEGSASTFEYTLDGRNMVFKMSEGAQVMMLQRFVDMMQMKMNAAAKAKNDEGFRAAIKAINEAVWTAVESRFTSEEDLLHVQMAVIAGRITEADLLPLFSNGANVATLPDDADPPAPARKAPAKKATKKTVSRAKK